MTNVTIENGGWNHRVFRHVKIDNITGEKTVIYAIHETYYKSRDSDEVSGFTSEYVAPFGETLEELREELEMMLKACDKPILDFHD